MSVSVSDSSGNRSALTLSLLVAVVALAALSAVVAGPAAAGVETNTTNFTAVGNDTLANETVGVDNDTQSVYVELDDTDGNASGAVNATFYGVDSGGNETQAEKVQITPVDNDTEMYEYTGVDAANYTEYRVLVEGNSSDTKASAVTVGEIAKVAGSGGGGSSLTDGSGLETTIAGIPVVLLAVAVGALIVARRD